MVDWGTGCLKTLFVKLVVKAANCKKLVLPEAALCAILTQFINIWSDISGIWRRIRIKSWMARRCQCTVLKTSVRQTVGHSARTAGKDVHIVRARRAVSLFSPPREERQLSLVCLVSWPTGGSGVGSKPVGPWSWQTHLPFLILFIPCILFEIIFFILDNNKCVFDIYKYRLISLITGKILTQFSCN